MNHRVDYGLMCDIADEFAKYFDVNNITMVLTAEASGIALATICAQGCHGVPMVFAKKAKSDNTGAACTRAIFFLIPTKRRNHALLVSQDWITKDDRVLIIDDFMARATPCAASSTSSTRPARRWPVSAWRWKRGFQDGGDSLRREGYPIKSLAIIDSAEDGVIRSREEN